MEQCFVAICQLAKSECFVEMVPFLLNYQRNQTGFPSCLHVGFPGFHGPRAARVHSSSAIHLPLGSIPFHIEFQFQILSEMEFTFLHTVLLVSQAFIITEGLRGHEYQERQGWHRVS